MKLLILLTTLAVVMAADKRAEFAEAMAKFSAQDGLLTSESKDAVKARYNSFVEFAGRVDTINADDSIPFQAENNFLSILTEEERNGYRGFNASGHSSNAPSVSSVASVSSVSAVPKSRDFRGILKSKVKNQGSCGSCWTFSATSALEGEMYFMTGKTVSLSEQEYVDCAGNRNGCKGGDMKDCYTYSKKSDRIAPESAAAYKGKDSGCNGYASKANALETVGVKVTGNTPISKGDANLLAYAAEHIISVAIMASNNFMTYSSGRYTDSTCQGQSNHAVTLLGYGELDGKKYWLVRNSWGSKWGNKGFVQMDRERSNMCRIADSAHIPTVVCRGSDCEAVDPDDADNQYEEEEEEEEEEGVKRCWSERQKGLLFTTVEEKKYGGLAKVQAKCEANPDCVGIQRNGGKFYVAIGTETMNSKTKNFIITLQDCEDDDADDDDTCPSNTMWCKSCSADDGSQGCCMHEHMCKD